MNFQKKNKKKVIYSVILMALGCYLIYNYIIYKPHKVIERVPSEYTGNANSFLNVIQKEGVKPWLNKIVIIEGTVTSKDASGLVLNNSIYCQLKNPSKIANIPLKQSIKLKGQLIGYDDLLEEIKLNYCIIKNTQND